MLEPERRSEVEQFSGRAIRSLLRGGNASAISPGTSAPPCCTRRQSTGTSRAAPSARARAISATPIRARAPPRPARSRRAIAQPAASASSGSTTVTSRRAPQICSTVTRGLITWSHASMKRAMPRPEGGAIGRTPSSAAGQTGQGTYQESHEIAGKLSGTRPPRIEPKSSTPVAPAAMRVKRPGRRRRRKTPSATISTATAIRLASTRLGVPPSVIHATATASTTTRLMRFP